MTPKEYIEKFNNIPLCYDDGILENDSDADFIRGQAHFKNHVRTHIISTVISILKELLEVIGENEQMPRGNDIPFDWGVESSEDEHKRKATNQERSRLRLSIENKIKEWEELLDNK